jgi:hypothetical protein
MGLALAEEVEIEESIQEGNQLSQGTPDGEGKEGCVGKDEVVRWSSLGGMRETRGSTDDRRLMKEPGYQQSTTWGNSVRKLEGQTGMKQEVFNNIYLHMRTRKMYMFLGMPWQGS